MIRRIAGRTVLIIGATLVCGLTAAAASYYLWPARFRSEAFIIVVPQRVSPEYVRTSATGLLSDRLQSINDQILSRTRLERIVRDFNLYEVHSQGAGLDDAIYRVRGNIAINILATHDDQGTEGGAFRVAFTSSDP